MAQLLSPGELQRLHELEEIQNRQLQHIVFYQANNFLSNLLDMDLLQVQGEAAKDLYVGRSQKLCGHRKTQNKLQDFGQVPCTSRQLLLLVQMR